MSLKEKIHFVHANGFPANSYEIFLNQINSNYDIIKFSLINNKYLNIKDWNPFHIDFVNSIDRNAKIIGIGHSIGGNIVLRSAITNPNLFSKIILLDPTLFVPRIIFFWKLAIYFNIHDYIHPWVKATLKRKMIFKDFNSMFESYRNKDVFQKINDKNLSIYIKALTKENNDGKRTIIYPKELEYQIYRTSLIADSYIWKNIKTIQIPTLIIRSKKSNAFLKSSSNKIKKINKNIKIIELDNCTHLFPLEIPESISNPINKFLNNQDICLKD